MTKSVIVMPTMRRPEMLALALEALDRHSYGRDLDVRIYADTNANIDDVEYVRDEYYPNALIFHAPEHVQVPSGMWNILNALKAGYNTGADRVFLIEEDVVINKDYFPWHDQAHKNPIMASLGRYHRPGYMFYTNPGSCFSRYGLGLVVPHINDSLFKDRVKYMNLKFGDMGEFSTLDDGLVRRIQKRMSMPIAIPDQPKCAHIGFIAYNHYMNWVNPETEIRNKINFLRGMLPKVRRQDRYTQDFEPILS